MCFLKAATLFVFGVAVCFADTISVQGTVKDAAGAGISGASVKLEIANVSTATGADGTFDLRGSAINNAYGAISNSQPRPVLSRGRLHVDLAGQTLVKAEAFNLQGRKISEMARNLTAGPHSFALPGSHSGITLYKVTIDGSEYLFESVSQGADAGNLNAGRQGNAYVNAAMAKRTLPMDTVIIDTITVSKTGYNSLKRSLFTYNSNLGILTLRLTVTGPIVPADSATDIDGNVYPAVRIGNQLWTIINLRVTKFNDGTDIPYSIVNATWGGLVTPAYCFYNNTTDSALQRKWGALYNWHAVHSGKLAPAGWRVPGDSDWTVLENYLIANGYNFDGTTTGNGIAKSLAAQTDWTSSLNFGAIGNNPGANNTTGFSALPAGGRYGGGYYTNQKNTCYWWSTTENDSLAGVDRSLYYGASNLSRLTPEKRVGQSVRLVRNAN